MFDSPFAYCPVCKDFVLLDQTQRECVKEHGCGGDPQTCPLSRCFTGFDFHASAAGPTPVGGAARSRRG